ncbi:MAG: SDR family NAD(P)-dependent oxidoreductase [Parvibaculaceae bacterium]
MINLNGKVVLVTGGSRGIGAAIATTVAAAGAKVVLHYGTRADRAASVAAGIGQERCGVIQASLDEPGAGRDLWRKAVDRFGHIDVLVNNAGIYETAEIEDGFKAWSRSWQRTLQINLIATADLCKEAIQHFRPRGGGVIVNIASRAAFRGESKEYMNYAASKGGMISLTRTIARGYAGDGVLAYAIAPGFTATEVNEAFFKVNSKADIVRDIPIGDIAPPEEVANIVAFLASGLARHATGSTVDVNGASYLR